MSMNPNENITLPLVNRVNNSINIRNGININNSFNNLPAGMSEKKIAANKTQKKKQNSIQWFMDKRIIIQKIEIISLKDGLKL